jgi:hypothetical protein
VEGWNFTFPPSPAAAIPTEVFDREKTLYLNSTTIALSCYGPSHTDGDVSAYLLRLRSFTRATPGGTVITHSSIIPPVAISKPMIKAAEANLARVSERTIVVPGHGKVGGKPDLIEYRDMLVAIHDRVAALKREGRSLDEIIAAKPAAVYDSEWAGSLSLGTSSPN